jgi:hypothetical protein
VRRLSGFPLGRVFGSGTSLDSSRFRTLVADRLGLDTRSVHGMIVGEHGDSSVAVWSQLNVGGVRLRDVNPVVGKTDGSDKEDWATVHKDVINAAYAIIQAKVSGRAGGHRAVGGGSSGGLVVLSSSRQARSCRPPHSPPHRHATPRPRTNDASQGYTNWAIGLTVVRSTQQLYRCRWRRGVCAALAACVPLCCPLQRPARPPPAQASLTEAVMRNEHRVMPLSVPVKGRYGITDEVYLSLPAVLGRSGVRDVLALPLDAEEAEKLRASAAAIAKVQSELDFAVAH